MLRNTIFNIVTSVGCTFSPAMNKDSYIEAIRSVAYIALANNKTDYLCSNCDPSTIWSRRSMSVEEFSTSTNDIPLLRTYFYVRCHFARLQVNCYLCNNVKDSGRRYNFYYHTTTICPRRIVVI